MSKLTFRSPVRKLIQVFPVFKNAVVYLLAVLSLHIKLSFLQRNTLQVTWCPTDLKVVWSNLALTFSLCSIYLTQRVPHTNLIKTFLIDCPLQSSACKLVFTRSYSEKSFSCHHIQHQLSAPVRVSKWDRKKSWS